MAKRITEGEANTPKKQYSNADVAEFMAALDTEDEKADVAAHVETEDLLKEKKIVVQEERPSIAQRRRVPLAHDQSGLDQVLTQPGQTDMGKLVKSKRRFPWGWVVGIVALLAVVSVAGFFFFNKAKRFANTNVQVNFKPITAVVSGSSTSFTIEYQNLEPVDLTNAELAIEYPEGFTYTSSDPTTEAQYKNSFTLGTIKTGQTGKVTVTGTLIGAVGVTRDFGATMTYRPANFNSDFQQRATTQATITSSILSLKLSGPTELAPGASGTWTATYTNTSDRDLKDVQITAAYPDGFTISSVSPAAQDQSAVWKFGSVKKGASGSIAMTGVVAGSIGDTLPLKISAGLLSATKTVDLQDEQTVLIILVKTGVTTTAVVNGSADPITIDPGETLNYSVRVVNSSDVELTNTTITAKLGGTAVDMTTLVNDSKAKVKDNVLTWTKDQLAALGNVKPGQAIAVNFAVGTKAVLAVATDADRDPNVTATIDVTAPALVSSTNSSAQPSTVIITKVATALNLKAEARYYDAAGKEFGTGPVPPKVGETTTYRVLWTITNTTSDATNLVVSVRLPNTTLWTGKNLSRDAGDLTFDSTSRMVRWTLNTVPAGSGGRLAALTAYFDVSITPTADQVGTVPILIETATATAVDGYTSKALTSAATTLTTDLPTDTKAAGQGQVAL